jgi:hypothetical protein
MQTNRTNPMQLPLPFDEPKRKPLCVTRARRFNGWALQIGDRLICDRPTGIFCTCVCGGELFTVGPRVGPHFAQLLCDNCGRGGRWLGHQYFQTTNPEDHAHE